MWNPKAVIGRGALALLLVGGAHACAGRQIEVGTGPQQAPVAAPSLRITNELSQPVNVYVVTGGTELFVRQVAARSTEQVMVQGVEAGTTVTLRARQVDGRQVYDRANVLLQAGVYEWRVP